jgi:gliding motility-associated-like protein
LPSQTTQYNVTATLGNCVIMRSVNIIVYEATLTVSDDQNLCAGESATLTANGSLTGEYLWSNGEMTSSITVSPSQPTTYDLLYTYGDGCTLIESVNVNVVPNFALSIVSDPDTNRVSIGETLSLRAVVAPSQNLSNFQFQWLENGTTNIGNTETIETTPSTNDSTIFYKLIATSPNGCMQMAQINFVLVQPKVVVPNAFTPNGDGVNDKFRMRVLEGSATVLEMSIYNRWGNKVFSSTDPDAAWDGKMDDGKDAPSDIYVYYIRWQRSDGALQPPFKGDIALLR